MLVTLVYLAAQIRQNTKVVATNTQSGIFESWAALASDVVRDPAVAALIAASEDPAATFSREDEVRMEWLAIRIFGQWENAYAQLLEGIFEPKHWYAYDSVYRHWTATHHFRAHWEAHREWYFDEFIAYVDGVHREADGGA